MPPHMNFLHPSRQPRARGAHRAERLRQGPGFIDNFRFIDKSREFIFIDKIYFIVSESTESYAPKHTPVYSFFKNSAWKSWNPEYLVCGTLKINGRINCGLGDPRQSEGRPGPIACTRPVPELRRARRKRGGLSKPCNSSSKELWRHLFDVPKEQEVSGAGDFWLVGERGVCWGAQTTFGPRA